MDTLKQGTGHAIGGYARAAALSPERRQEIARNAAFARYARQDSARQDFVQREKDGLTNRLSSSKVKVVLIKDQPSVLSIEQQLLKPLLNDKSVVLSVKDTRLVSKVRITNTLLFFTPMSVFGGNARNILVALPGYGSEIFSLDEVIKPIIFYRLGLNPVLSKALVTALTRLVQLEGIKHGQ